MSEFDVNLISAFAKCPAFYDKSNPNFKDRVFTENAWKEISLQLGFDEKVLRDRMFQLRNRYNLEKRKVEMQDGDPNAKSTWPLFDRMSFLEGHIRPRKSYKSIMSRSLENNEHGLHFAANNAMFLNSHRNNQPMRNPYPPHHQLAAVQNVHNARLQQLANHIQMMATNSDEGPIDLGGDAFSGIPSMMEMFESDDRANPFHLLQQQQQHMNLQHQLQNQSQQHQQRQQQRIGGGSSSTDNHSEIKPEFYSESEDDEDGLRDTETDTTSKSKDDLTTTTSQVLGEILNNVAEDGSNARNTNQSQNGSIDEPGQSTGLDGGNDLDDNFLNPMDLLVNRQTTGPAVYGNSSSTNSRYGVDTLKRKGDVPTHNNSPQSGLDARVYSNTSQPGPNVSYKRRRRNYQNMIPNGLMSDHHHNSACIKSNMLGLGNQAMMLPGGSFYGSNTLLANQQALLLAQLQNGFANQPSFLQSAQNPVVNTMLGSSHNAPPDKFTSFGQFLASSLSELSSGRALELIAKFTVEVTTALREEKDSGERGRAAPAGPVSVNQSSELPENRPSPNNNGVHNNSTASNSSTTSTHNLSGNDKYRTQQF